MKHYKFFAALSWLFSHETANFLFPILLVDGLAAVWFALKGQNTEYRTLLSAALLWGIPFVTYLSIIRKKGREELGLKFFMMVPFSRTYAKILLRRKGILIPSDSQMYMLHVNDKIKKRADFREFVRDRNHDKQILQQFQGKNMFLIGNPFTDIGTGTLREIEKIARIQQSEGKIAPYIAPKILIGLHQKKTTGRINKKQELKWKVIGIDLS